MTAARAFSKRRPARSPQQIRADWLSAISLAWGLSNHAGGDEDVVAPGERSFGQNITRLTITLRDLKTENFPVNAESARAMAGAFLTLARHFCHPAWSTPARTACAPFLKAGAICLEGLITNLRTEEARGWRDRLGERDED